MKLSAKTLAEDIKKVELSAELQKFYDENVKEMVDLYGEDETIDELINKFVEKANAYLDKNAKKDEPKAEPKAEEKPKKEEKTKKEPKAKAEKQPKAKFKVGDWVKDVTTDKVGGKVLKVEYDKAELVFKYVVLFEDNAKRGGDWYYEYNLAASTEPKKAAVSKAKAEKPKKEAEPKEKKQPEGEPMAKVSPEITIIQRFVRFGHSKKATANTARLILVALQKMIVNKEIRKTSQYADEIMAIQKALLSIVKNGKTDFDRADFERYEKIAGTEYQEPVAKLSRSFISLIGRTGVKDKAKNLLKKFKDADVSNPLVAEMIKSLQDYVSGNAETVETTARSLQGIFGLAGI